jgi:predicted SAM-dependent methyltransferase
MLKLNLGAGGLLITGMVAVDIVQLPYVDVVHDLDRLPWLFRDASADEIFALDIYEHDYRDIAGAGCAA